MIYSHASICKQQEHVNIFPVSNINMADSPNVSVDQDNQKNVDKLSPPPPMASLPRNDNDLLPSQSTESPREVKPTLPPAHLVNINLPDQPPDAEPVMPIPESQPILPTNETVPQFEPTNSIPLADFSPESQSVVQIPETPPPTGSTDSGGLFKKILILILGLVVLIVIALLVMRFVPGLGIKPVTINYWGLWENQQIIAPVIAEYEKTHPRVKIVYTRQSPKQYRERLASSLARGEGPDIFRFHNTWTPMFSQDLAPVPVNLTTSLNFSQNYYPIVTNDLKRGTSYYGIPLEIDGLGLFINEDIFKEAGLTYPSTWEEMRTDAQKLTVRDDEGKIRTAGVALGKTTNVEHWPDILGLMMMQNGVNLANPTDKYAEDALTYFTYFSQPPSNTWDDTLDNSILAFANGQVAMIFAPSWEAFEIKNINPNVNFRILPVPQLPGSNITWASYWVEGVWMKSKNKKDAFEFLNYLASKDVTAKLFTEESKVRLFGEPYARLDMGSTLTNDQYAGAYIKQAPSAKSFYMCSRTFDNGINDKIIKYYEDAINSLDKGVSPTAALETTAKGVQQVLATYGLASTPIGTNTSP
ncbi:MAG: extracellular solute-binding protein [Candidatus Gottesmanbacteria bacterium]